MEAGPSGSQEGPPTEREPAISLVAPIGTTVASYGQKITIECQFKLKKERFYYALWTIGGITVKRSDENFNVASLNGHYILSVNQVQHCMEGRVTFSLREHIPPNKSICAHKMEGQLIVVPFSFTNDYVHDSRKKINNVLQLGTNYSIKNSKITDDGSLGEDTADKVFVAEPNTPLMEIFYCRLDYTYYYFKGDISSKYNDVPLIVKDITPRDNDGNPGDMTLRFSWSHPMFKDTAIYFKIELQYQKMNKVIGITEAPSLKIAYTSVDDLISITISTVTLNPNDTISDIVIDMRELEQEYLTKFFTDYGRRQIFRDEAEFNEVYTISENFLGAGTGGKVFIAKKKRNLPNEDKLFAAKKITNRGIPIIQIASKEFNILQSLQHKNIVFVSSLLITESKSYIIMEYLWGESLLDTFSEVRCNERNLVHYIKQVCEALAYLQDENICHLDLKPENIVLVHPNSRKLKLIDFGVSKHYNGDRGLYIQGVVGTRTYIAPELWRNRFVSAASDMWSLGILMYYLLCGSAPRPKLSWGKCLDKGLSVQNTHEKIFNPFLADTPSVTVEFLFPLGYTPLNRFVGESNIAKVLNRLGDKSIPYSIHSFHSYPSTSSALVTAKDQTASSSNISHIYDDSILEDTSDICKDFISRLLTVNYMQRMKARTALNHAWIKYGPPKTTIDARDLRLKAEVQPYVSSEQRKYDEAATQTIDAGPAPKDTQKPSKKGKGVGKSSKPIDPRKDTKAMAKSIWKKLFKK